MNGLIAMTLFTSVCGLCAPLAFTQETLPSPVDTLETTSLLEFPSLPELGEEDIPSSLDSITPLTAPEPILETRDPAVAKRAARQDYFRAYAVTNPLIRTAPVAARSNSDGFFDGLAGVPRPGDSPYFPVDRSSTFQFRAGPVKLRPSGPSISYNQVFASRESNDHSSSRTTSQASAPAFTRGANHSTHGGDGTVNAALSAEVGEPESGRFLTLDYGLSYALISSGDRDNRLGQSLSLIGQLDFAKLKLGLGISFDNLSGNSREFARDVERDLLTVSLTSTVLCTAKTSLALDLSLPITQYAGGIDSSGFASTASVNYAYSTKTSFSLDFTGGVTGVSGAETQTYQQVRTGMTSSASPFLSYTANVGCEWRDTGETKSVNPVWGLGLAWTPRDGSSLTLTFDQRIQNSAAIEGANFTSTSVSLLGTQRLGSFGSVNAGLGYERARYTSNLHDQSVDRLDQTFFAQAGLTWKVMRYVSLSGMVSYYHTDSNELSQEVTQVTISAGLVF